MKIQRKKVANKSVAREMLAIESNKKEINRLSLENKQKEQLIIEQMSDQKVNTYVVDNEPNSDKFLTAMLSIRQKVSYNIQAIKSALPKAKCKMVSDSMLVVDSEQLKVFLKHHPELRDELKPVIQKVSVINENKLGLALQYGEITLDDLSGCYEISESSTFKLQRVKRFDLPN